MATMKTLNGYGFNATELNGKTSDSYLQLGDDAAGSTGEAPKINADTLGGVDASNYLKKTDTASDTSKLGGKAPEYYIQPRNLLDNSDFRNPVNQRGKTNYTGGGYTIDRWLLGIYVVVVNVLDDGIEVTGGDSTYNAPYIQKVPENLTGKTVTFAVCDSDGVITTVTGAVQTDSACITNAAWGNIEFYHSSSDGTLWVQININYGGSKIFRWAALYEGAYTADTLPPYVPKGYAAELAECRRYAKRIGGALAGIAHGYERGKAYATIFTSGPEMRIAPSVDDYSKIQIINGEYYSDQFTSITGIATIATREDSITFWIESSEISAGKDYYISCEKGVLFSSDL